MIEPVPSNNELRSKNRSASGGVNTFSSPLDIEDDQVVDLTNGLAAVPGVRKVRPGASIVASGPTYGPILAMTEFTPSSFTPELLIVTPGASYPLSGHLGLWKWNGTGNFTFISALTGMTAPTLPVEIVTGLDLVAAGGPAVARITSQQGLDFDYYYAGTTVSACTGGNCRPSTGMFPMGTAVGRAFAAGRSGVNRGKIFYSDVASWCAVTGWSSNQSFTMGGGTRQEIVAVKDFRGRDLVIFLSDRIEVLKMDGDPIAGLTGIPSDGLWSRETIDRSIGCGARRTVQTVGEDLFWLDQYGNVRSLQRTITDNSKGTRGLPVSAKIQTFIDRINPSAIGAAQATVWDRYYVIALPLDSATEPSHTFVYDVINESWVGPWDGPWAQVKTLATATLTGATSSADRNPTLYIGGTETLAGEVYRAFVGTGDDGSPIVFQETTRRESFGTLDATKMPQRLRLYTLPSPGATMMIEARKNGAAFSLVGYADLSGQSPQLPSTLPVDLTGQGVVEIVRTLESSWENALDLQFRFTCTAASDLQILGYTIQALLNEVDWEQKP